MEYLCHKCPGYVSLVVSTSRSYPHSRLITGFVIRLTRPVPPVEQELLTLPEHLSLSPISSRIRVTRSLVLWVCFVDRCLFFCPFSFGHCIVCSSLIYGFVFTPLVSSNSQFTVQIIAILFFFYFILAIVLSVLLSSTFSCHVLIFCV